MPEWLQTLGVNGGICAILYGFHFWKIAPEIRAIWRSIDRMNRVRLLGYIASPRVAPEVKEEAAAIVAEIDREEARGQKREIIPP